MPVGIDIAEISRFEKLLESGVPSKIFTPDEAQYINTKKNRSQTAAGIFAAKEAFLKVCGEGIYSAELSDIEVRHFGGAPYLALCGSAERIAERCGFWNFDVSISHDGGYAVAIVSAETDRYFKYYRKVLKKFENAPNSAITPDAVRKLLPKRRSDAHKGTCGRLYALAGSVGLTGAAVMACTSALKCGAGLITLGCAKGLNSVFETTLKEVMTKPLDGTDTSIDGASADDVCNDVQTANAVLIGPGLGRGNGILKITSEILNLPVCVVADADALNAISEDTDVLRGHRAELIVTPHIGEFSRLTGIGCDKILKNTKEYAKEFAQKYNVTVVLKSHRTVVASPGGICLENVLGNPGMATGGTGDVLCGAVASFAAQGLMPFDAAAAGTFVHSLAADMASLEKGEYSLTPSDILDFLPYALKFSTGR